MREPENADELFRLVAHELRTPISALLLQISLLARTLPSPPSSAQAEILDRQLGTVHRLVDLIDGFVAYSRLQAGAASQEPSLVNLAEEARVVVEAARPRARRQQVELEVSHDPAEVCLCCDGSLLRLSITCLLAEAIKLSRPGQLEVRTGSGPRGALLSIEPWNEPDALALGLVFAQEMSGALGGQILRECGPGVSLRLNLHLPTNA